jgi:hypothetical protein
MVNMYKFKNWLKKVGIKVAKTMAETALAVIGTNTIGITDVDWLGVLSACALSGVVTILFNIKSLPEDKEA